MANKIKSSGSTTKLTATRNTNFKVGVNGSDDYGPTSDYGFYNGITPPASGYTIYVHRVSGGPSMHVANDDSQCIFFLKSFGATGNTISEVINWSTGRTDLWVQTADLTSADLSTGQTFSQLFTFNAAPSTATENTWTAFRSQLTGTYTTMTLSNSLGTSLTVSDAKVQDIANALRTATTNTNFSVVIGANTWRVLHGCVAGTPDVNSIYLTNDSACNCGGGGKYTIRPMIKNLNWGGLNGSSCAQPTQTMTVTFS